MCKYDSCLLVVFPVMTAPSVRISVCPAHAGQRLYSQSSWLLQCRLVRCLCKSHPTATDGAQRRRSPCRRHWQVWPHHAGSSRHSPLAASTSEDWVQDRCSCVRLCPWYWPCLLQRCLRAGVGALSVRWSVVTCLFLEQEQWSSVDGFSRWLLRSSGIHYRLTYDHHW